MKVKRYTGRKIQQGICGVGAGIAFLLTLGIVGGIEKGYMPFNIGAILTVAGVICFAILLWGAGALEGRS